MTGESTGVMCSSLAFHKLRFRVFDIVDIMPSALWQNRCDANVSSEFVSRYCGQALSAPQICEKSFHRRKKKAIRETCLYPVFLILILEVEMKRKKSGGRDRERKERKESIKRVQRQTDWRVENKVCSRLPFSNVFHLNGKRVSQNKTFVLFIIENCKYGKTV